MIAEFQTMIGSLTLQKYFWTNNQSLHDNTLDGESGSPLMGGIDRNNLL